MSVGSNQSQRLENQAYCFKTLPIDKKVDMPTHAGFYAYLAGLLLANKKNDLLLNIPETIIIRNEENLTLGEKTSPRKSPVKKSRSPKKSKSPMK
jgi:hypothetical protein